MLPDLLDHPAVLGQMETPDKMELLGNPVHLELEGKNYASRIHSKRSALRSLDLLDLLGLLEHLDLLELLHRLLVCYLPLF